VVEEVAEHHLPWDGIAQALKETARVLRPGGQLLIVNLNRDGWVTLAIPRSWQRGVLG